MDGWSKKVRVWVIGCMFSEIGIFGWVFLGLLGILDC